MEVTRSTLGAAQECRFFFLKNRLFGDWALAFPISGLPEGGGVTDRWPAALQKRLGPHAGPPGAVAAGRIWFFLLQVLHAAASHVPVHFLLFGPGIPSITHADYR